MPYKNPEHKRQWEREHREHRNAQRRMRRLEAKTTAISRYTAPDRIPPTETKSGWKAILGFAIGLGIVLMAAMGGINVPDPSSFRPPNPGSGTS